MWEGEGQSSSLQNGAMTELSPPERHQALQEEEPHGLEMGAQVEKQKGTKVTITESHAELLSVFMVWKN